MTPNIIPIDRMIKTIESAASEADWRGDRLLADSLYSHGKRLRHKMDQGILYEVMF